MIGDLPGLEFREVLDPEGDLATMLTVILPTAEVAKKLAKDLGTKVAAEAGWHVYNNMEQLMELRTANAVWLSLHRFPVLRRRPERNSLLEGNAAANRRPLESGVEHQHRRARPGAEFPDSA